jgi:cyanophycinase
MRISNEIWKKFERFWRGAPSEQGSHTEQGSHIGNEPPSSQRFVSQTRKVLYPMEATTKGQLIIIGGNEDKLKTMNILRSVVERAGAQCISVIPTASAYGKELGDEYAAIFTKLGIPKAHVIAARYVGDPDTPEYHAMVDESDAFFFTGGDQVKLVEVFQNTDLFQKIVAKHNAGALIAGTSAGAAAVSEDMLFDGDDQGFKKGSVYTMRGFGFLPNITVDTHFIQRNRIPRLAQILARRVASFAIGVDEDTALAIEPDGMASVVGSEIVTFMRADEERFVSNYDALPYDALYTVSGVSTAFLAAGAKFHLPTWSVVSS